MIEIKGKYSNAIVYGKNIEEDALEQIRLLCSQEFSKGSTIRVMPDAHVGMGCTIGMTITIGDKLVPYIVGVDIGCGIETVEISWKNKDFENLDKIIRSHIPSGFNIRSSPHPNADKEEIASLRCIGSVDEKRAVRSIGTLGGGNHFIEVDKDSAGGLYLLVHSGSRNLGKQVAEHYQKIASKKNPHMRKDMAYIENGDLEDYVHDMKIVQKYAQTNRETIVDEIISRTGMEAISRFSTVHNYLDTKRMIVRKGAVSAQLGEKILIPINMRDGSLICEGMGNEDWNYSAPHGAGRLMSRRMAQKNITLEEFAESMRGVWTTSVGKGTIDESPMAYKPIDSILDSINETARVILVLKPLYNFKAK